MYYVLSNVCTTLIYYTYLLGYVSVTISTPKSNYYLLLKCAALGTAMSIYPT